MGLLLFKDQTMGLAEVHHGNLPVCCNPLVQATGQYILRRAQTYS